VADPLLPPYLGSWQDLVNASLHNPFLGGGRGGHPPLTHLEELRTSPVAGPVPDPWLPAASYLLAAISVRDIAARIPNKEVGAQIGGQAERTIEQFLDDYCGTPPRVVPWPWPGPPPWVFQLVSQLALIGNSLQEGSLREGILNVAARALQRSVAPQ
jgi:hypothetical protein